MRQSATVSDKTPVIYLMEMPNGGASDVIFKKDMADISNALERVLALRPVTWYWKSDTANLELQHGFIAQEVEKVFPDLVAMKTRDDGVQYLHLSTKGLLPYLVRAIEEQQQQINALCRKFEASEKKE